MFRERDKVRFVRQQPPTELPMQHMFRTAQVRVAISYHTPFVAHLPVDSMITSCYHLCTCMQQCSPKGALVAASIRGIARSSSDAQMTVPAVNPSDPIHHAQRRVGGGECLANSAVFL